MKKIPGKKYEIKLRADHMILLGIMIFAAVTRLCLLDKYPNGFHQDESYSAYNAWSLMTSGPDSRGYMHPVYFTAWGDGMNALYAYICTFFFRIFGVSIYAYRLPQAILSIICTFFAWKYGQLYKSRTLSILLSAAICLCPWNIINSRWGLESNLAPGLFFIGTYFLLKYLEGSKKSIIPALTLYGLTLYSYAMTWLMIPTFLLIILIIFRKKIHPDRYLLSACIILMIFAVPLLLFIAVNKGLIPEIRTNVISIPMMNGFRSGEMSLSNIVQNIKGAVILLIFQHDFNEYLSSEAVGGLYRHLTPFYVFGILFFIASLFWKKLPQKISNLKNLGTVFFIWLIVSGGVCLLKELTSTTHFNMVFFPLIFFQVYGVYVSAVLISERRTVLVSFYALLAVTQIVSFCVFANDYINKFGSQDEEFYTEKTAMALDRAKEIANRRTICICEILNINYSYLMWHDLPDARDFSMNAEYADHGAWNYLYEYGDYRYYPTMSEVDYDTENVYILPYDPNITAYDHEYIDSFLEKGFHTETIGKSYMLAYCE